MSRVFVVGSINMDVVATAPRHPRPGETVPGERLHFFPGGKGANQAVASARAGGSTHMVGKIGTDAFGDQLHGFLESQGVDTSHVLQSPDATTGAAVIVVNGEGENTIVVVPGTNGLLTPEDVSAVALQRGDIVLCQLEIPLPAVQAAFSTARALGAATVLNAAPAVELGRELLELTDVLVVNELELSYFVDEPVDLGTDVEAIAAAARTLRAHADQMLVVTLGPRGAVAVSGERTLPVVGRSVEVVDTTGAGDCFVGTLVARLAAGEPVDEALLFANAAAAICVQRMGAGTSMPTADEVQAARSSRLPPGGL